MPHSYLIKTFDYSSDGVKLLKLLRREPYVFFLDSSLTDHHRGRFSFIGFDPFDTFFTKDTNGLPDLKKWYHRYAKHVSSPLTPFPAGIMGYLAYDFGLHLENLKHLWRQSHDDINLPDCFFGFYDVVITIDHWKKKLHICSTGLPETSERFREQRARARLKDVLKKISHDSFNERPARPINYCREDLSQADLSVRSNFSREAYFNAVGRALEYIRQGDIYQVNLSQRFTWDQPIDPFRLYKTLRFLSASHFGAYFDGGDFQIVSSSPERFLQLKGNRLMTRPMKGTRPRGKDLKEDQRLREELFHSKKDKSELLMITDLERNDFGRVCDFGSVRVGTMRALEAYSTVFQTTSTVEGTLRKDKDCFDAIAACFPGGSITGCPKIRSMEIINELEPNRRGVYTGAMGYINTAGDMDFNILIRTLLTKKDKIHFHAGGGIVADSFPEDEYQETLTKAKAMSLALSKVEQPTCVRV